MPGRHVGREFPVGFRVLGSAEDADDYYRFLSMKEVIVPSDI